MAKTAVAQEESPGPSRPAVRTITTERGRGAPAEVVRA